MINEHLTKVMRERVQNSGIKKQGACHIFRHTMATHLHDRGADIRVVQRMLGHANISSTEIYTHVRVKKLKETHHALHPAEQSQTAGSAKTIKRALKLVRK